MTPIFLSKVGTNPSVLSFNIRGDDGKLVKEEDKKDKGKMKTVVFIVLLASMWGKHYYLRKDGWSEALETEQHATTASLSEDLQKLENK